MHVQVEPGAVFVAVWRSVEKDDLALVPTLVALLDVGQIEAGHAVRRVRADLGDPTFVALATVCWI